MHSTSTTSRPTLITIICGFAFVQWILTVVSLLLFMILKPEGQVLKDLDVLSQLSSSVLGIALSQSPLIIVALIIAVIGSLIGIWYMQRFAVILYAAVTVVLFIFLQSQITSWTVPVIYTLIMTFLYPLAILVLSGVYFKRMR
jgi:Zn-dependent protease with chaperone function